MARKIGRRKIGKSKTGLSRKQETRREFAERARSEIGLHQSRDEGGPSAKEARPAVAPHLKQTPLVRAGLAFNFRELALLLHAKERKHRFRITLPKLGVTFRREMQMIRRPAGAAR